MAKTANIYARIDGDTKTQAEKILKAQGISVSKAINLLYVQIISQRGVPFALRLPEPSQEELLAEKPVPYNISVTKESNINVRIDPDFKNRAELILRKLGVTTSNAINLFFKQVILIGALPLEMTQPPVLDLEKNSEAEITESIQRSFEEMRQSRVVPAQEFFAEMEREDD